MYQSTHTGAQVDEAVDKALGADATPTPSSTNLVQSGGVFAALSNRNLLDNPWFTVNQRGLTSYAWNGVQYAIDRWKWDTVSTAPLEVQSDGVNLNASAISAGAPYMRQIIDNVTAYRGKKLTFSALVSSVSGASNIGYLRVYAGSGTQWGTYIATGDGLWSTTFTVPSDASAFVCDIGVYSGKAAKVVAAKLELGSVSTLANDAPPNYAEELAKCQRYLYVLTPIGTSTPFVGTGVAIAGTQASIFVPLPVTMRSAPTPAYSGTVKVWHGATIGSSGINLTGFAGTSLTGNGVSMTVTVSSGLTTGEFCMLQLRESNPSITLSADL